MGGEIAPVMVSSLSLERRCLALELLACYANFEKICNSDGFVVTAQTYRKSDEPLTALSEKLAAEKPGQSIFTQEEVKHLAYVVDFLAVAQPDLVVIEWQAQVLSLASYIRKVYFKSYGCPVYD